MGESMEQRLELAFELRSLGIASVPINILNPMKGTKLENAAPLSDEEILTTIAVFRFILPNTFLRFAGGRINVSKKVQEAALEAGINSSIVGDLLTTSGTGIDEDFALFAKHGYKTKIQEKFED
jgi:biotin synthase-like enzyme